MSSGEFLQLALVVFVIVEAAAIWFLARRLQQFMQRYEQFRGEGAAMFDDTWKVLTDLNMRVTQAGWPPGRLTPRPPEGPPYAPLPAMRPSS